VWGVDAAVAPTPMAPTPVAESLMKSRRLRPGWCLRRGMRGLWLSDERTMAEGGGRGTWRMENGDERAGGGGAGAIRPGPEMAAGMTLRAYQFAV